MRSTQIVVGYDGSPDSAAALDWAIREAGSRHCGLRLVYCAPDLRAYDGAATAMAGVPMMTLPTEVETEDPLAPAAQTAEQAGVSIERVSTVGSVAGVLVEQSRSATMVVLGSRGHGAFASAILGSTVAHVASHAHCPVIVAQARGSLDGPVVVGVDGTKESEEVIGWGMDHASRHGLPLQLLHAYALPAYPGVVPYAPPEEITRSTQEFEARLVAEALAGWREQYPDVEVQACVQHGRPGPLLVAATSSASLTVVGSHGRGAFLGVLLGSTSQSLLQHAVGTVGVIRHHKH